MDLIDAHYRVAESLRLEGKRLIAQAETLEKIADRLREEQQTQAAVPADQECPTCFGEGAVPMSTGYERHTCTLCNGTGRFSDTRTREP